MEREGSNVNKIVYFSEGGFFGVRRWLFSVFGGYGVYWDSLVFGFYRGARGIYIAFVRLRGLG